MLLQNLGYSWKMAHQDADGYVILASRLNEPSLTRNRSSHKALEKEILLFDPQMYLTCLKVASCLKTLANLATYPWIQTNAPEFDSGTMKPSEFRSIVSQTESFQVGVHDSAVGISMALQKCFELQKSLRVSHYIVPTPIIDHTGNINVQLEWIDAAASVFAESPVLVTLAFSDASMCRQLSDTVLDNLSARNVDGIYLVVGRTYDSIRLLEPTATLEVLYLCHRLAEMGRQVFVNFVDDLGLLCLSLGASGFCTGYHRKERRLVWSDYEDTSGWGKQFPQFYSRRFLSEFLPETDMSNKMMPANLIRLFQPDWTIESEPLRLALESGRTANTVPEWREADKNIKAAFSHRILLLKKASDEIATLNGPVRLEMARSITQDADMVSSYVLGKLKGMPLRSDLRHIPVWAENVEKVLKGVGL